MSRPRLLDLFCGAGIGAALELVGIIGFGYICGFLLAGGFVIGFSGCLALWQREAGS